MKHPPEPVNQLYLYKKETGHVDFFIITFKPLNVDTLPYRSTVTATCTRKKTNK